MKERENKKGAIYFTFLLSDVRIHSKNIFTN
jgi:hypothetical protein